MRHGPRGIECDLERSRATTSQLPQPTTCSETRDGEACLFIASMSCSLLTPQSAQSANLILTPTDLPRIEEGALSCLCLQPACPLSHALWYPRHVLDCFESFGKLMKKKEKKKQQQTEKVSSGSTSVPTDVVPQSLMVTHQLKSSTQHRWSVLLMMEKSPLSNSCFDCLQFVCWLQKRRVML